MKDNSFIKLISNRSLIIKLKGIFLSTPKPFDVLSQSTTITILGQFSISSQLVIFPFYWHLYIKLGECKWTRWSVHSNLYRSILSFRSYSKYKYFSSDAFHFKSQFWTRMTADSGCYRALTLDGWNSPFMEAELRFIFTWDLLRTQLNDVRVFMILVSTIRFLPLVHLSLEHLYWVFSMF